MHPQPSAPARARPPHLSSIQGWCGPLVLPQKRPARARQQSQVHGSRVPVSLAERVPFSWETPCQSAGRHPSRDPADVHTVSWDTVPCMYRSDASQAHPLLCPIRDLQLGQCHLSSGWQQLSVLSWCGRPASLTILAGGLLSWHDWRAPASGVNCTCSTDVRAHLAEFMCLRYRKHSCPHAEE